jgi:DNA end-binding protein Ku
LPDDRPLERRKGRADEAANEPHEGREGPRPMWSGSLAFGLVAVPIELHSSARSTPSRLRLLAPDGIPLQRRYRCPTHDRLLDDDEIVRGWPIGHGRHVAVTDAELDALSPERSGEMTLLHFVEHGSLPLPLVERTLYMAPRPGSARPYRLLAVVMERMGLAGIARFVMRGHEHLAAIVAAGGLLRAELLRFESELRKPDDVGLPPPPSNVDRRWLEPMRRALADLRAETVDLAALHDEREDRVRALAEQQLARGEGVVEVPAEAVEQELREQVVDLMNVIKGRIEGDAAPAA